MKEEENLFKLSRARQPTMPRGRPPGSKNKKTLEAEAAVAKVPFPDDDAPLGSFVKTLNKTADKTVSYTHLTLPTILLV